ncbi:HsdM family class I SAM-dependent methyltransferase [Mycoplasma zalophi]|uniref:HsdM family class I SAM-dependent methyltransferase n=1 Tax=Mycoplasma zalophi TaxID=191287 RepID=UPI001C0F70ED|nr:N-6 DNA methylase [Mycoplasma zalophi]MBU4690912.1 SAM-dependent methyltransferase [Mycoplasma zalophi]
MTRNNIINKVGSDFLTANLETDEFSYVQALKRPPKQDEAHWKLDIRFEKSNVSLLIETKKTKKKNFSQNEIDQLLSYVRWEREYKPKNNIIAILYDTNSEKIKVWKNEIELEDETTINSMQYYVDLFENRKNDKNNVIETTNSLNNNLHKYGIPEKIRSQFVGSLLVALNNGLEYSHGLKTKEIIARIVEILESKIDNDENKKVKTDLLINILKQQEIREMKPNDMIHLVDKINRNLIPYIDCTTSQGEDLLNLFFTTFNKYVGKADKNQAFTPTHITDFMCEIAEVNKASRVLDPTCGSGAFLVQAMSKMLAKAGRDEEAKINIKKNQIFGIEKEEKAFGLATTNMLIHQDGKTNVVWDSCFDRREWIKSKDINVVLMNPPFNGQKMPKDCPVNSKKDMDATKGFYFVEYVASVVGKGKLATILPLQCAIGTDKAVAAYKKKMLKNHTLKAVFSMNDEIFHPGASVNACIMLFELGISHDSTKPTFFGYFKDDGFIKRKNKGRIEKRDWNSTKKKWLELYDYKKEEAGYSVLKCITAEDEWLAEAYMKTDYSILTEENFIQSIRDFIAFKVKGGDINE